MTITTRLITLAASAQQLPALSPVSLVQRILIEPLRTNTHAAYVGLSNVTNDGTGTGVIRELAQPPAATVILDSFEMADWYGVNTIDPTTIWVHGTTGEKLKASYYQS